MSISTSKEMFINMNPKDVPRWDSKKSYFEQELSTLQFFEEELKKITYGVNIGGYYMSPWLYYHINFFKTPIPVRDNFGNDHEIIMNPPLNDNMFFVSENYQTARKENKMLFLFGSRGVTKSVIISSLEGWTMATRPNGNFSIVGGSSDDLKALSSLMEKNHNEIHPAFYLPTLKKEWDSYVEFGIKEKSGKRLTHGELFIKNADPSKKGSTEKGAGLSPIGFVIDEAGKFDFWKLLESAIPSFKTQSGWKLTPLLAGCVCAGTKVWTNTGKMINIEDLTPEQGILGFNQELGKVSQEKITYWQPPHEKPCYRIKTKFGRVLECSEDHPILFRARNEGVKVDGKWVRKVYFKETKDIKKGQHILVPEQIPFFGNKEMWEPRVVGILIGDGRYTKDSTPMVSGCDDEIHKLLVDKFDTRVEVTYKTKDGRLYQERTIKGICKHLRDLGIYTQSRTNKRLPDEIDSYDEKSICELLGGIFDADGYVTIKSNTPSVGIGMSNEVLIDQIHLLLHKLGIHASKNYKMHKPTKLVLKESPGYVLTIASKRDLETFLKKISFSVRYKQKRLEDVVLAKKNKRERIDKNLNGVRIDTVKSIEYIGIKPVYNLTAGTTHTYLAGGIITHNTGGNNELSKDAKKVLSNPKAYDVLPMNWDLLNNHVPEEYITWKNSMKKPFGTFFPGQMTYREAIPKKEERLSDYVGKKNKDLDKIKIMTTDWKKGKEVLEDLIDKNTDIETKNRNRMYYPRETDDCFLTAGRNPFPAAGIDAHIRDLVDKGKVGKPVEFYKENEKTKIIFSSKQKADADYTGGAIDAPCMVFGEVPETPPERYIYVAGFDDYKVDTAEDSVSHGSLCLLKRRQLALNEPCEVVVASYTARPDLHTDFHKKTEEVLDIWSAYCLMEAIDTGFLQYLDLKGKSATLLWPAVSYSQTALEGKSTLTQRYGMYPTKENKEYMLNLCIDYTKERYTIGIDENGNEIVKYGYEFIEDLDLLIEMRDYKKGKNADRLTAFGHALVLSREMDNKNIRPKSTKKSFNLEEVQNKSKTVRSKLTLNKYSTNTKLKKY